MFFKSCIPVHVPLTYGCVLCIRKQNDEMAEVIKYSLEHYLRNTFQSILTDELCLEP